MRPFWVGWQSYHKGATHCSKCISIKQTSERCIAKHECWPSSKAISAVKLTNRNMLLSARPVTQLSIHDYTLQIVACDCTSASPTEVRHSMKCCFWLNCSATVQYCLKWDVTHALAPCNVHLCSRRAIDSVSSPIVCRGPLSPIGFVHLIQPAPWITVAWGVSQCAS